MAENAKSQSLIPEAPVFTCEKWGLSLRKQVFNEAAGLNLFARINLPAPAVTEAMVEVREFLKFPEPRAVAFKGIVKTNRAEYEVMASLETETLGQLWNDIIAFADDPEAKADYARQLSYWRERLGLTSEEIREHGAFWPEPADDVFSGLAVKPESYYSAAIALCLWAGFLYWSHGFCRRPN